MQCDFRVITLSAHEIFASTVLCSTEGRDKKATKGGCPKIYKGIAFIYILMQGQSDIKQFSSLIS
jgi:hypothetical protein